MEVMIEPENLLTPNVVVSYRFDHWSELYTDLNFWRHFAFSKCYKGVHSI